MCGRYYIEADDEMIEEIRNICAKIDAQNNAPTSSIAVGEVFPTNSAPVITENGPVAMKWGFPMYNSTKPIINARSETATEKPMFSAALKQRRIVVPTSGFYEWMHVGTKSTDKYLFTLAGEKMLCLAGLYTNFARPDGTREDCFSILTTEANESMRPYHNRMPVYIAAGERDAWLSDPASVGEMLHRAQPELNATKQVHGDHFEQLSFI